MFLCVEQSFGAGFADHLGQLHRGDGGVEFVLRVDVRRSQGGVGAQVVERDDRPGGSHEQQVDRHEQHRGAFRAGDGDVLRHHLAEQDVQHHHDRQADGERDGMQQRIGHPGRVQRHLDQVRDGRFGDAAEQDRADRDAELGAGEHEREVFAGVDDGAGAGLALGEQRLEPVAADGDEGELGADEEGVAGEQQHGEDDPEPVAHRCSPPSSVAAVSSLSSMP